LISALPVELFDPISQFPDFIAQGIERFGRRFCVFRHY
jgi:hypothetical protein